MSSIRNKKVLYQILEKLFRSGLRALLKILFRVRIEGAQNFELSRDPTLVVCNHTSLLDGVMLYAFLPNPPVFLVNKTTAKVWYFKIFLHPISKLLIDDLHPMTLKKAIKQLIAGETIVVFPEGRITTTGVLMKIYAGPAMLAAKSGARVMPIGIEGLQHSRFSYLKSTLHLKTLPPVKITISPPEVFEPYDSLPVKIRRARRSQAMFQIMQRISFKNTYESEDLFESLIRSATKHGGSTPIISDPNNPNVTYRSLIARAFILSELLEPDLKEIRRVGILLPSTVAAATAFFALQHLGKEVVLLNFSGGITPLMKAISISKVKYVITSSAFVDIAGIHEEISSIRNEAKVTFLEDVKKCVTPGSKLRGFVKALLTKYLSQTHRNDLEPEHCAVILFTSGSEGNPKGVALSHANILKNYAQAQVLISINKNDHVLNVLPIFHAFGLVVGLITPLLKGTPSYQYPSPLHYRKIPEICYQQNISCLLGTNTFLSNYAKHASSYDFYNVRWVLSGAEKLSQSTKNLWQSRFGIRIFEGYGVTEASPVLAVNHPLYHQENTVGQLLPNIEYKLIAVDGLNEGGELAVKGPNIMLGYLDASGEVSRTCGKLGLGWYDTGDIVKVNDDGFISIIGRQKRFVKIGGEMVSLATIENFVQTTWPEFEHVALGLEDLQRGEQIVLISTKIDLQRSELIEAGKNNGLAPICFPKKVVYTPEIPYLPTGKIDHGGLKELAVKLIADAH
jgi:acyl-[acyl-carrier-protein]-phospholipid O-acyltransferase/long-chain-fatty-acid--[acyl-carrier-protein] ligase